MYCNMSRLLSLPAELRVMIYRYVYAGDEEICLTESPQVDDPVISTFGSEYQLRQPLPPELGLIRTCRLVYEEALPILFANSSFFIYADALEESFAANHGILPIVGTSLALMRQLRVQTTCMNHFIPGSPVSPWDHIHRSCPDLRTLTLTTPLGLKHRNHHEDCEFVMSVTSLAWNIATSENHNQAVATTHAAPLMIRAKVNTLVVVHLAPEPWYPDWNASPRISLPMHVKVKITDEIAVGCATSLTGYRVNGWSFHPVSGSTTATGAWRDDILQLEWRKDVPSVEVMEEA